MKEVIEIVELIIVFYLMQAIIISSEALTALELRGPHDVANLGFIFGLNEQQGKIWVVK